MADLGPGNEVEEQSRRGRKTEDFLRPMLSTPKRFLEYDEEGARKSRC